MSENFHVNMSYFGSVVVKEKPFQWPHQFFHFYDYLPFKKGLALYLVNLEFPLPQDDLY
jgi:hypothetical protein